MSIISKGNAIVIPGAHLNADTLVGWYLGMDSLPPDEIASKFLSGVNPELAASINPGDILVCGRNFGFGKVHAAFFTAFKMFEMECIVAESFSTQMVQVALAQGIYLVECPDILTGVKTGDEIEVDIENAIIRNLTQNTTITGKKFPPFLVDVMDAGGQMGYLLNTILESE